MRKLTNKEKKFLELLEFNNLSVIKRSSNHVIAIALEKIGKVEIIDNSSVDEFGEDVVQVRLIQK